VLYISIGLTFASNDCREAVLVVGWKTQSAGRSTGARSGAGLRGRSRRRKATESSQTTRTAASVAAAARLDTLHRCLHSARVHRSKVQLALDPETSDKQRCPATGKVTVGLASHWPCVTKVCDAWPVQRQTYDYLPSRRTSLPRDWYQIILLGDRGTCV